MAHEKDAFGFYFSAHPVDRYRHLADANGAKSFSALASLPVSVEGGRTGAVMAGLIEEARWRTSAKGKRYLIASLSDASGQFEATVFDDAVAADIEAAAKVGGCGLLTVELDRKPGEEAPRITVKRVQPFEALARRTRVELIVTIADPGTMALLAADLKNARGGSGQVLVEIDDGARTATLMLGRDFDLDAELAARIERIVGSASVRLGVIAPPQLALVG
jgi:DNA polymerase-3 subunit alpha